MLSRFRAAGLILPTLLALPVLALLIGLGTWQMQRKAWKEGLQRDILARTAAAPVPLEPGYMAAAPDRALEYTRVRARGRFLHGQERHLYWLLNGRAGWLVMTPLVLADRRIVLVNRGWVPEPLKQAATRPAGQIEGTIDVVGLVRMPQKPGSFTPANSPQLNVWMWRDIEAMLRCQSAPADSVDCRALSGNGKAGPSPSAYPFSIDSEAEPANPGGWPRGGTTSLDLPNRHLEYALTWYGLAATLVGVWLAFALARLRAVPDAP